jgi:hypothetical protein
MEGKRKMNFLKLWENMNASKEGNQSEINPDAISAIRTGMGVNETFWEDFIQVLNNSEGLSALLDIDIEEIATWRKKIEDVLSVVKEDDGEQDIGKNKKLVRTGMPDFEDDDDEE